MVDTFVMRDINLACSISLLCVGYDRAGIEQWLRTHSTSPLDPSFTLTTAGLRPNRAVWEAIGILVESGDVDEETSAAWREKKRGMDLKRAKELFDDGRVLDAAKLGLPKAQGIMANRYYWGKTGAEKDLAKCFEWATKAARGGDKGGQILLGCSFSHGEGVAKSKVEALKWYELAAAQGCVAFMFSIGLIHEHGALVFSLTSLLLSAGTTRPRTRGKRSQTEK